MTRPTLSEHTPTTRISTSSTVMVLQYAWSSLLSSATTYHSSSTTDKTDPSTTAMIESVSRPSTDDCMSSSSSFLLPEWTTGASNDYYSGDEVEAGPTIEPSLPTAAAAGAATTTKEFAIAVASHNMQLDLVLSFVSLILWITMLAMICSTIVLGYRLQHEGDYGHGQNGRRTRRRKRIENGLYHDNERQRYVKSRLKIVTVSQSQLLPLSETINDTTTTMEATGCSCCCYCCCICLDSFHPNDLVCQSPNSSCRHVFHWDRCMSKWLSYHDHCPVCRRDYVRGDRDEEDYDQDEDSEKIEHHSVTTTTILPYVEPLPLSARTISSVDLNFDGGETQEADDSDEYDDDDYDDDISENDLQERLVHEGWDTASLSLLDDLPTWLI